MKGKKKELKPIAYPDGKIKGKIISAYDPKTDMEASVADISKVGQKKHLFVVAKAKSGTDTKLSSVKVVDSEKGIKRVLGKRLAQPVTKRIRITPRRATIK